ncbi:hypothetical protein [Brevundimonas diminuta]|uniref:hypothetical protein n=1 Tax=Brevundimonas diminuta TaxID=293 RepID=UPI001F584B9A|nr:hypothetical protein [Brevundimonas diminuta]
MSILVTAAALFAVSSANGSAVHISPTAVQTATLSPSVDQLAERKCAEISSGGAFDHSSGDDVVRWLARELPSPKDDYDTEESFRRRLNDSLRELTSETPVFVVSIKLSVQRYNSTYDPFTEALHFQTGENIECNRVRVSYCLRPGYSDSSKETLFAVHAEEDSIAQSFGMPSDTARFLRENGGAITVYIVASLEEPYRTRMRFGLETMTMYHLHAHCLNYDWPDAIQPR